MEKNEAGRENGARGGIQGQAERHGDAFSEAVCMKT